MRELKFRCWDGETMWYYDALHLHEDVLNETEDWKPMQFIGLIDKNGKEIYEGDIIWHEERESFRRGLKEKFVVNDIRGAIIDKDYTTGEVIGNIYENQDLLK